MKVRFKKTPTRKRFGSRGLRLKDGDTAEVPWDLANHLLRYFSDNFEPVYLDLRQLGPLIHQPISLSDITLLNVCYYPSVLQKSLLSYLPEEAEFLKLDNEGNKNWRSMPKALNYGIRKAQNDIIICTHEDTRFDPTWFGDFIKQECRLEGWGALGIVGMDRKKKVRWGSDYNAPRRIDLLDACCIILDRKNNLLFDEDTFRGWHRYDFDFCLQCHQAGLGVYTVTGLAYHDPHPKGHRLEWRQQIAVEQKLLERKWQDKFPELLEAAF